MPSDEPASRGVDLDPAARARPERVPPEQLRSTIVAARSGDVTAIAAFQTACWREAYRGLVPEEYLRRVSEADREARWRERLLTGARQIALSRSAGTVVGVVSWAERDPTGGLPPRELTSLYVAAPHRGTGLAQALLGYAVGDGSAYLWVFAGNERALAFYRKLGFAADGAVLTDPDTGLPELRLVR